MMSRKKPIPTAVAIAIVFGGGLLLFVATHLLELRNTPVELAVSQMERH
jgi:hypothetical protein